MNKQEAFAQILLRCKNSPSFFMENFCKVKHPTAGIRPFRLFSYQQKSLIAFRQHRFNCYKKTRQCGISTLSGAFALWYAMFYCNKTILVVSKGDRDAVAFLEKNIKFVYQHLPEEFHEIYGKLKDISNEHTMKFPNGSSIQSLPSSDDVLRSNSASLNIIDESAFMKNMQAMWTAGYSTLMHGGSVIVVSTTNGQGSWYHITWVDAIAKRNQFNPIEINWWDMDWAIEYVDEFTKQKCRISPRDGIRKCETKEEQEKYGPYWSPWLETQYVALQQRGEADKYRQEILAEFIGTGQTVLPRNYLLKIDTQVNDDYSTVKMVDYIHPVSEEKLILDFDDKLWIWKKPVRPTRPVIENGRIIRPDTPGHVYSLGVDVASGEAADFSTVEVFDHTAREQVAELNIKALPNTLAMMVDYIGRWYNMALVVPETTGLGKPVALAIYNELGYPNLFRMKGSNGKASKKVGFPTTHVYKPLLIKALLDHLNPDEDGYAIYSRRLFDQLSIFVNLGENKYGSVKGPGNHDDLSIGASLALLGSADALISDSRALYPTRYIPTDNIMTPPMDADDKRLMIASGGVSCMPVVILGSELYNEKLSPYDEFIRFQKQMGGLTPGVGPSVVPKKNILRIK